MGRELRRVSLDFHWPLKRVWRGFINPYWKFSHECFACGGGGYNPKTTLLSASWYGAWNMSVTPTTTGTSTVSLILTLSPQTQNTLNEMLASLPTETEKSALLEQLGVNHKDGWQHHITQDEVQALVDSRRLVDFTDTWTSEAGWQPKVPAVIPTAREVNIWSRSGMGHDCINHCVCVETRAKRLGFWGLCPTCEGDGRVWEAPHFKEKYENWKREAPPEGPGYQIWETVSEGSPISPVFATPEELALWMATPANDTSVTRGTTYEGWMKFILGPGWATSAVGTAQGLVSGVQFVSEST